MTGPPADPATLDEWREAADAAETMLLIHSAACYGHITGINADDIDVDRCEELLARAAELGIRPRPVDDLIAELVAAPIAELVAAPIVDATREPPA